MHEVRCPVCGTVNRLPRYYVRRRPWCGNCRIELPEPWIIRAARFGMVRWKRISDFVLIGAGFAVCLVGLSIFFWSGTGAFKTTPPPAESKPEVSESGTSEPGQMKFELLPPDRLYAAASGDNSWTILATGFIDEHAPDRLMALVRSNRIPAGSSLHLNSPGGNLMAGIRLGRAIRAQNFDSHVGQYDFADKKIISSPGECASACTLAFLGGRWRYLIHGSRFGVHRFYFGNPTAHDGDAAQVVSALVVKYISEMGVNTDLFAEMSAAGPDSVALISEEDLVRLNAVNNGVSPTVWTIESENGTLLVKGQRDTAFGQNMLFFACSPQGPVLAVSTSLIGGVDPPPTGAISLIVSEKQFPIQTYLVRPPDIKGDHSYSFFNLPPSLVHIIERGAEIGVLFQVARDAPTFVGFRGMPMGDGGGKMLGVLKSCSE